MRHAEPGKKGRYDMSARILEFWTCFHPAWLILLAAACAVFESVGVLVNPGSHILCVCWVNGVVAWIGWMVGCVGASL